MKNQYLLNSQKFENDLFICLYVLVLDQQLLFPLYFFTMESEFRSYSLSHRFVSIFQRYTICKTYWLQYQKILKQFNINIFFTNIICNIWIVKLLHQQALILINIVEQKNTRILKQQVPQSLFIIKLNARTQQFELLNQGSSQILNVEDTKTLINVFRNIMVVLKGQITIMPDLININHLEIWFKEKNCKILNT